MSVYIDGLSNELDMVEGYCDDITMPVQEELSSSILKQLFRFEFSDLAKILSVVFSCFVLTTEIMSKLLPNSIPVSVLLGCLAGLAGFALAYRFIGTSARIAIERDLLSTNLLIESLEQSAPSSEQDLLFKNIIIESLQRSTLASKHPALRDYLSQISHLSETERLALVRALIKIQKSSEKEGEKAGK